MGKAKRLKALLFILILLACVVAILVVIKYIKSYRNENTLKNAIAEIRADQQEDSSVNAEINSQIEGVRVVRHNSYSKDKDRISYIRKNRYADTQFIYYKILGRKVK